jgi:hypothetical protein
MFRRIVAFLRRSKRDRVNEGVASPASRPQRAYSVGDLDAPEFWYMWFHTFGPVGDAIDESLLLDAFRIESEQATRWWNEFTCWYEGVLEEADGQVENPGVVSAGFRVGVSIEAEIHPGDIYFHLNHESTRLLLGNIGPHWALPFISSAEAMALSSQLPMNQPSAAARAFLFLAVGIWLTQSERENAREAFVRAARASGVVEPAFAEPLADAWVNAITVDEHAFYNDPVFGVVTKSPWSQRNPEKHENTARTAASLLRAAGA